MFKIVNDMVPPYLSERFVKRETEYGYNTRGSHINRIQKPNTNFLKYSLYYSGAAAWHSIPVNIR